MTTTRTQCLTRHDAVGLSFCFAAVFATCIFFSHGRQLWSDEVFGLLLAHDPSLRHMLFAWRNGADGGGVFFYLFARAWTDIFGTSALALRLFTASGMSAALALTWLTARRWYRFEIVAFTLPFCWLTAHSLLRQLMIGRFYGMLLAAVALTVLCYSITAENPAPTGWRLVSVFAAHCFLVGIHPFGLLYSAVVIAATITLDATRRTWRPRLYAAALAGWMILWPSRFALRASEAVAKPHFWTTTPNLDDLQSALVFWTDEMQWLWAILFAVFIAFTVVNYARKRTFTTQSDKPSWVIGIALMATVPFLWVVSQRGTSYFVDRYLLPTLIGAVLLQCAALQRLIPSRRPPWLNWTLAAAIAAMALGTIWGIAGDVPTRYFEPPHTYIDSLVSLVPSNVPVVVERADIFAEAITAKPDLQFHYLLDWDTAMLPESPRGEVSGYHEMENWQRVGYHASAIQSSSEFLARQTDFWIIADPAEFWFSRRVQNNPVFQTRQIGTFQRERTTETVWHVHRLQ